MKKRAENEPVDLRTTERIIKEILSWNDDQWESHKARLNTKQLQEMRHEIDDLALLFGKLKSDGYNWRKAALVCLPAQYVGLLSKHFLAAGELLQELDPKLDEFSPYCSHKNLMEYFHENDGEQVPLSKSSNLIKRHSKFHEMFVDGLYEGFRKVLYSRGKAGEAVLKSLFWRNNNADYRFEKIYKSDNWENVLREVGPYAYLLRDQESVLASNPVGARVTTFIRQISWENDINACPPDQQCRMILRDIDVKFKSSPAADGETGKEISLHALLLHHIGLNCAYLEYSAHYLDIRDYALTLVEAIKFYEKTGIHIENKYFESLQKQTGAGEFYDEVQLLMHLADRGLREEYPSLALSKDQCQCMFDLAKETIQSYKGAKIMLIHISERYGEDMAAFIFSRLATMSAFCFIWFFVRNEHVNSRIFGRKHTSFSLLGRSLNKSFLQLEVSQQNLLKHIVMAVRRSDQWLDIPSAARIQDYLRARAFNLVTLTAKIAAIKRMDLYEFNRWAQSINFSDYLAKAIGESVMVDMADASIMLVET